MTKKLNLEVLEDRLTPATYAINFEPNVNWAGNWTTSGTVKILGAAQGDGNILMKNYAITAGDRAINDIDLWLLDMGVAGWDATWLIGDQIEIASRTQGGAVAKMYSMSSYITGSVPESQQPRVSELFFTADDTATTKITIGQTGNATTLSASATLNIDIGGTVYTTNLSSGSSTIDIANAVYNTLSGHVSNLSKSGASVTFDYSGDVKTYWSAGTSNEMEFAMQRTLKSNGHI